MRKVALVCAGGFCGTLARYLLMAPLLGLARTLFPAGPGTFPYDILVINLSGAFALGILYGLVERGAALPPDARLAVGTGFLGAYTTFSTFVYGGDKLLMSGAFVAGLLYLCGSMALGVVCAWAGRIAATAIISMRSRPRGGIERGWHHYEDANISQRAYGQSPPDRLRTHWPLDATDDNGHSDAAREEEEVIR